jgi:hypothetical protein
VIREFAPNVALSQLLIEKKINFDLEKAIFSMRKAAQGFMPRRT